MEKAVGLQPQRACHKFPGSISRDANSRDSVDYVFPSVTHSQVMLMPMV